MTISQYQETLRKYRIGKETITTYIKTDYLDYLEIKWVWKVHVFNFIYQLMHFQSKVIQYQFTEFLRHFWHGHLNGPPQLLKIKNNDTDLPKKSS